MIMVKHVHVKQNENPLINYLRIKTSNVNLMEDNKSNINSSEFFKKVTVISISFFKSKLNTLNFIFRKFKNHKIRIISETCCKKLIL